MEEPKQPDQADQPPKTPTSGNELPDSLYGDEDDEYRLPGMTING
ncbi:MAG: hypothetical protein WCO23_04470 [bacterium]